MSLSTVPLLTQVKDEKPVGKSWTWKPWWDGARSIDVREGVAVHFFGRAGQPRGLGFDAPPTRVRPAASHGDMLSKKTPAGFMAFELLALEGEDWPARSGAARREVLPKGPTSTGPIFFAPQEKAVAVSPRRFDESESASGDGAIARREDLKPSLVCVARGGLGVASPV
jgi:hypothetical protein